MLLVLKASNRIAMPLSFENVLIVMCRSWLTVVHPAVTVAIVETEDAAVAPAGLVAGKMRRRSGCPAPSLAVSNSKCSPHPDE